jgi:hypothetical protein
MAAIEEDEQDQGNGDPYRSAEDYRAITPVKRGLSRSPADSPPCRSGNVKARTGQIPS